MATVKVAFLASAALMAASCSRPDGSRDRVNQPAELAPETQPIGAALGQGWDTGSQSFKSRCVASKESRAVGQRSGSIMANLTVSASEVESELGLNASSKGKYKILDASLAAKLAHSIKEDDYSEVFIFKAEYNLGGIALDEATLANTPVGDDAQAGVAWQESCGDEVVYQVDSGARFYFVQRLEFASSEEKKRFEAETKLKFDGKLTDAEIEASINMTARRFAKTARMTVEIFQFGGDPTKLGSLFEPDMNGTTSGAQAIVACDITDLAACKKLRANAVAYTGTRAGGLVEQLKDPRFSVNPIKYVTVPWSHLRRDTIPRILTQELVQARSLLNDRFDRLFRAKVRIERLIDSADRYRIPEEQLNELREWGRQIQDKLVLAEQAVNACFEKLKFDTGGTPLSEKIGDCFEAASRIPSDDVPGKVLTAVAHYAIEAKFREHYPGETLGPIEAIRLPAVTGFVGASWFGARVYWSPDHDAHLIRPELAETYHQVDGPELLGLPSTDTDEIAGGLVNFFKNQEIDNAMYARDGRAVFLRGERLKKYLDLGGPHGPLGFPLGELPLPSFRGIAAVFERGNIVQKNGEKMEAFALMDPIRRGYGEKGFDEGPYGFPVTDEISEAGGEWRHNDFEGGSIYVNAPSGTIFHIAGAIGLKHLQVRTKELRNHWGELLLGFPVSTGEALIAPNNPAFGRAMNFQRGGIYTSDRTSPAVLGGEMFQYFRDPNRGLDGQWCFNWRRNGCVQPGIPVADEKELTNFRNEKGRMVRLENGRIYWSPATGAHIIASPFLEAWLSRGGEQSRCGFPTNDFRSEIRGVLFWQHLDFIQTYENGEITFNSDDGSVSVSGCGP